MVKVKFDHIYKNAKYIILKDLLDNIILLVLNIYALFFHTGDFNSYIESYF